MPIIIGLPTSVVEVGADQTGGGGGLGTPCIKIGYSSREPRRVPLPCIKIGYVSAMYKDMEPTQCIKIGDACIKIGDACIKIGSRLNVLRYGADSMY